LESALLPPKSLLQPHDTGTNFSSVDSSLKDLLLLLAPRSKTINIGTPISSPDVPRVHLESKNYILPINFEAVLDESLYSDTVYAAESITYEGIHISNLDDAGWTTAYKFIYDIDDNTERNSDFLEDNYVATGTVSTSTDSPKRVIYRFREKIN